MNMSFVAPRPFRPVLFSTVAAAELSLRFPTDAAANLSPRLPVAAPVLIRFPTAAAPISPPLAIAAAPTSPPLAIAAPASPHPFNAAPASPRPLNAEALSPLPTSSKNFGFRKHSSPSSFSGFETATKTKPPGPPPRDVQIPAVAPMKHPSPFRSNFENRGNTASGNVLVITSDKYVAKNFPKGSNIPVKPLTPTNIPAEFVW